MYRQIYWHCVATINWRVTYWPPRDGQASSVQGWVGVGGRVGKTRQPTLGPLGGRAENEGKKLWKSVGSWWKKASGKRWPLEPWMPWLRHTEFHYNSESSSAAHKATELWVANSPDFSPVTGVTQLVLVLQWVWSWEENELDSGSSNGHQPVTSTCWHIHNHITTSHRPNLNSFVNYSD